MLSQKSFYPLYPPHIETPIDFEQIEDFLIPETPDIMITPSELIQFTKVIDGCVCINPGQVIKKDAAGIYCSVVIEPNNAPFAVIIVIHHYRGQTLQ